MQRRHRVLLIVFALLGLVASVAALYVHYRMLTTPDYTSFCDINATVSCQDVLSSSYSRVLGIPIAAGGAIWAGLVLLLAWRGMGSPAGERPARAAGYIFVLATLGLAVVFYFGYVSLFVLKHLCPLCITMYVAVIGTFATAAAAAGPLGSLPSNVGEDLGALRRDSAGATLTAVWIVAAIALIAFFPREQSVSAQAAAVAAAPTETLTPDELDQWHQWLDAQTPVAEMAPTAPVKVLVVKFNDFECPACRASYIEYKGTLDKYEAQYPTAFKYELRDFPLEAECGVGGLHPAACEAAVAVRLAKRTGREQPLEDWFYNHQEEMTRDTVKQAAKDIANVTDFDEEYAKVLPAVHADSLLGQKLGVNGTPTFFINGIRISSVLRVSYFDEAIRYELQKAGVR
ncbi:MAG TPA: vitamin K epoxide reductase family protein [Vicinamibacterales bacterium]|nr:vitamin K epoxide reductase family protein [Vicinamibacterales bacterium]